MLLRFWNRRPASVARAEAIAELSRLTDHQLWDLGVERHQIEDYVDGALKPAAPPVAAPTAQIVRLETCRRATPDLRQACCPQAA